MAKQKSAKKTGKKTVKAPARSAASRVKKKLAGLASNPMVAELLSATLLAAAETLRGAGGDAPKKLKKAPARKKKKK